MIMKKAYIIIILLLSQVIIAQQRDTTNDFKNSGWFSLGARSTASTFGDEGNGIGTGGQFRIQMNNAINTDWFFDYISINVDNKVRSEYYHIGWSVIYYPFSQLQYPKLIQPYILAGHCFDYNKMTSMELPSITKDRWGSAAQAGLGLHFNITHRFDVTLMSQYMIHFTETLHAETDVYPVEIHSKKENTLQGHLLTTVSLNYKVFRIWKRKK